MIQTLTARVKQLEVEIREFRQIKRLTTRVEQLEAELRELQQPQPQRSHQLHKKFLGLPSALANASPTEQKTILCGNLYPLVEQIEGKAAAKVTKMILRMDVSEVLHLMEYPQALEAKVGEAMEFLRLNEIISP